MVSTVYVKNSTHACLIGPGPGPLPTVMLTMTDSMPLVKKVVQTSINVRNFIPLLPHDASVAHV